MKKEIERFRVVSDDGEEFVFVTRHTMVEHRPLSGPPTFRGGSKRMVLANGSSSVNFIDDDTFQIVQTDQIVRGSL